MTFTEHTDHGPAHSAASLGNSPDSLIEIYNRRPEELDSPLVVVGNLEETLTRVDSTNIVRRPYETFVGKMAIISDPDGRKIILREETN